MMGMSAFVEYLQPEEVSTMEKAIGPVAAIDAHPSVKLVYSSRPTLTEQARQLKIIAADLAQDIQQRTQAFQVGGEIAEMLPEEKKRLSAMPLNNDMCERPLGLVGEEQKQKPNEKLATSEATAMAKINKPFEYIAQRPVEEKKQIWRKSRQEQKKEAERNKEHIERMQAQKREKIRKLIEAAKKRESKAAAEQAEYKDEQPINTSEELQEHLAGLDEAVKLDVLRDQIKNWNSKGVAKSKLSIGKDKNNAEALQKKLEAYLDSKLDAVMVAVDEQPENKKRQGSADSREPNAPAAKRAKTEEKPKQKLGTKRPREQRQTAPRSEKGKRSSSKAQSKGKSKSKSSKTQSKGKSESKTKSKSKTRAKKARH